MVEDDPKDVELTLIALEEYKLANKIIVLTMANKPSITCVAVGNTRRAAATTPPSCCWT